MAKKGVYGRKKSGSCKKKSGRKKSVKIPKIKWWGRSYAY